MSVFGERLLIGTAGVPHSARKRDTLSGICRIAELGLDAMELEFVRGVRMSDALAAEARAAAEEEGVVLTAHGPYWINLNAQDPDKEKKTREYIIGSAVALWKAGGVSLTFHAGSLMGGSAESALAVVRKRLGEVVGELRKMGVNVDIRPELTGKRSQVGSLEDLISLSSPSEGVFPCVDFAHHYARTGTENSQEAFGEVLDALVSSLGKEVLNRMHIHVSGIDFTSKGERRHLNLADSDFDYRGLLRALRERECAGVLICESPNLEEDAMLLKEEWERTG